MVTITLEFCPEIMETFTITLFYAFEQVSMNALARSIVSPSQFICDTTLPAHRRACFFKCGILKSLPPALCNVRVLQQSPFDPSG